MGLKTLSFLGAQQWNKLTNELKGCSNLNTFKHKMKMYYFDILKNWESASFIWNNMPSSKIYVYMCTRVHLYVCSYFSLFACIHVYLNINLCKYVSMLWYGYLTWHTHNLHYYYWTNYYPIEMQTDFQSTRCLNIFLTFESTFKLKLYSTIKLKKWI